MKVAVDGYVGPEDIERNDNKTCQTEYNHSNMK